MRAAYSRAWGDGDVVYSTNEAGGWDTTELYDGNGAAADASNSVSIGIDSAGDVHIAYAVGGAAEHASNATGDWVSEIVDGGWSTAYVSVVIDDADVVHMAYGWGGLSYATNAGGLWSTERVSDGRSAWPSLGLDADGDVHIAFYASDDHSLEYATNAFGAWDVAVVDTDDDTGSYPAIAVDSSGASNIAYLLTTSGGGSAYDLRYASDWVGVWRTETIDSDAYSGEYASMAIDDEDVVHVAFHDISNGDLRYARRSTEDGRDNDCDGSEF